MAEHLALAICPKLYLKSVPTIVEVRDSTKENAYTQDQSCGSYCLACMHVLW